MILAYFSPSEHPITLKIQCFGENFCVICHESQDIYPKKHSRKYFQYIPTDFLDEVVSRSIKTDVPNARKKKSKKKEHTVTDNLDLNVSFGFIKDD